MINKLQSWNESKLGLLVIILLGVVVFYIFASLAENSGNLFWYLVSLIAIIVSINKSFKLIGEIVHGKHRKASKTQ